MKRIKQRGKKIPERQDGPVQGPDVSHLYPYIGPKGAGPAVCRHCGSPTIRTAKLVEDLSFLMHDGWLCLGWPVKCERKKCGWEGIEIYRQEFVAFGEAIDDSPSDAL